MTQTIYQLHQPDGYWTGEAQVIGDADPVPDGWVAMASAPSPGGGEVALAVAGGWENVAPPNPSDLLEKAVADINQWCDYWFAKDFDYASTKYSARPAAVAAILGYAEAAQLAIDDGALAGEYDWHPGIGTFNELPDFVGAYANLDAFQVIEIKDALTARGRQFWRNRLAYITRAYNSYWANDLTDLVDIRTEVPDLAVWIAPS